MAIDAYDPHRAPDPAVWLAASEDERREAVKAYHEDVDQEQELTSNMSFPVNLHVIVEDQITRNDLPMVAVKLRQLMARAGPAPCDPCHWIGGGRSAQAGDGKGKRGEVGRGRDDRGLCQEAAAAECPQMASVVMAAPAGLPSGRRSP